jgi:putative membrane protein
MEFRMKITSRLTVALTLLLGGVVLADNKAQDDKPITDAEFVAKATSGGMFEIKSSKLAKDGGASSDVKKFADRMIEDHQKAGKELMEAAKAAGIEAPTKMLPECQKRFDKVKEAKGTDFDMAYMRAQLAAHEDAVALFTNASKSVKDPGLKAFAEKTLPVIKEHYEQAKKLTVEK